MTRVRIRRVMSGRAALVARIWGVSNVERITAVIGTEGAPNSRVGESLAPSSSSNSANPNVSSSSSPPSPFAPDAVLLRCCMSLTITVSHPAGFEPAPMYLMRQSTRAAQQNTRTHTHTQTHTRALKTPRDDLYAEQEQTHGSNFLSTIKGACVPSAHVNLPPCNGRP
jgi:hypothetical protein